MIGRSGHSCGKCTSELARNVFNPFNFYGRGLCSIGEIAMNEWVYNSPIYVNAKLRNGPAMKRNGFSYTFLLTPKNLRVSLNNAPLSMTD